MVLGGGGERERILYSGQRTDAGAVVCHPVFGSPKLLLDLSTCMSLSFSLQLPRPIIRAALCNIWGQWRRGNRKTKQENRQ